MFNVFIPESFWITLMIAITIAAIYFLRKMFKKMRDMGRIK